MARSGDVIHNPLQGQTVRFIETSSEMNGELVRFEAAVAPGGFVPRSHRHWRQEERFQVVSGTIGIRLGREAPIHAAAGQELKLPPNTPHIWWNDGHVEAVAVVELRPALDFDIFLETLFGLARVGKTDPKGNPGLIQSAVLARRYSCYLSSPPVMLQRPGVWLLSQVGRRLGYHDAFTESGQSAQGEPSSSPGLAYRN